MNDTDAQSQKDRFEAVLNTWLDVLSLRYWRIEIVYRREYFEPYEDGFRPDMSVRVFWRYLRAEIEVSLPSVADMSDERLENMVVHEIAHILINELSTDSPDRLDHEERVAETLARSFLRLRDYVAAQAEPEKSDSVAAKDKEAPIKPEWIVNDIGELGVKIGTRCFFLYKGNNIEYEDGKHHDGTPIMYRMVGKREFGETCKPEAYYAKGYNKTGRYTEELVFHPVLSFGQPEDGAWKPLPSNP